jgi:hypothetical protein
MPTKTYIKIPVDAEKAKQIHDWIHAALQNHEFAFEPPNINDDSIIEFLKSSMECLNKMERHTRF